MVSFFFSAQFLRIAHQLRICLRLSRLLAIFLRFPQSKLFSRFIANRSRVPINKSRLKRFQELSFICTNGKSDTRRLEGGRGKGRVHPWRQDCLTNNRKRFEPTFLGIYSFLFNSPGKLVVWEIPAFCFFFYAINSL